MLDRAISLYMALVLDAAQWSKGLIVVWDVCIVDCRWHSATRDVSWYTQSLISYNTKDRATEVHEAFSSPVQYAHLIKRIVLS